MFQILRENIAQESRLFFTLVNLMRTSFVDPHRRGAWRSTRSVAAIAGTRSWRTDHGGPIARAHDVSIDEASSHQITK